MSMSDLFHDCVEAIFLVGRVFDDAVGSIGFVQSVLALNDVAIAVLPLRLVVAGFGVLNSVFVFVRWVVVWVVFFMSVMLIVMFLDVFVRSIVMTWFAGVLSKRLKNYFPTYRGLQRCVLRDGPTHLLRVVLRGIRDEQHALGASPQTCIQYPAYQPMPWPRRWVLELPKRATLS